MKRRASRKTFKKRGRSLRGRKKGIKKHLTRRKYRLTKGGINFPPLFKKKPSNFDLLIENYKELISEIERFQNQRNIKESCETIGGKLNDFIQLCNWNMINNTDDKFFINILGGIQIWLTFIINTKIKELENMVSEENIKNGTNDLCNFKSLIQASINELNNTIISFKNNSKYDGVVLNTFSLDSSSEEARQKCEQLTRIFSNKYVPLSFSLPPSYVP